MEKLLSKTKTKGGSYVENLTNQRTNIFALAVEATQIYFASTLVNNLI